MIDYFDEQWWKNEKVPKVKGKAQNEISDSDLFQIELLKIEEALASISHLIRKYMAE